MDHIATALGIVGLLSTYALPPDFIRVAASAARNKAAPKAFGGWHEARLWLAAYLGIRAATTRRLCARALENRARLLAAERGRARA